MVVHAKASQNALSFGKPTDLRYCANRAGPIRPWARSSPYRSRLSRTHPATVFAISARGPAGEKSWSPPSIVKILLVTRACASTDAYRSASEKGTSVSREPQISRTRARVRESSATGFHFAFAHAVK